MSLSENGEYKPKYNNNDISLNDMRLDTTQQYRPVQRCETVVETVAQEKKKCWLLRPIAWIVFLLSVYLMNIIINTGVLLGAYVVDWLSTLPTGAVILLTLAFGSIAIGILFSGVLYLPSLAVMSSNLIYPSKNGVRYYIVGVFQLLTSLFAIISTLTDPYAEHVLLDCSVAIYFAIVYIFMLCGVKSFID